MSRRQRVRLIFVFALCSTSIVVAYLVVIALRENINLFLTPSQINTSEFSSARRIRIGGVVERGSVMKDHNLEVRFRITDFKNTIPVYYKGILPDLFKEGQGVVVLGVLKHKNEMRAEEVLAKHDENYMPPNLQSIVSDKPTR